MKSAGEGSARFATSAGGKQNNKKKQIKNVGSEIDRSCVRSVVFFFLRSLFFFFFNRNFSQLLLGVGSLTTPLFGRPELFSQRAVE